MALADSYSDGQVRCPNHLHKGALTLALLDIRHPFFRPLWRRVVVTAICLVWAVVEFAFGSPMFGILSGALGAWCLYQLFWIFDPAAYGDKDKQ